MCFQHAHDDIGPGATHRLRRNQHCVGFADARGGAEEDLQLAARRALLLRLEFREELIGVGPLSFHRRPSAVTPSSLTTRYSAVRSSARLSVSTLTRGSPRTPN